MANELLTDQKITRKALDILHDKLNFIGNINRQYDDQYANTGGKIGSQLKVRLPNEYVVRHGRVANPQSTNEQSTTIVMANQDGVDLSFYSDEMTLSIDDFAERHLEPAMSVLASYLESQALNMALDVSDHVGTPGTQPNALSYFLNARRRLNENLAPDSERSVLMNGACMSSMVNALSSLYNPSADVSKMIKKGFILNNSGFDFYENNMMPVLTFGSRDNTTPLVNGANQGGDGSLICDGFDATATIVKGDVFTVDGVYAVHPETKAAYGYLKQFTVTAAATCVAGAVTLSFSPPMIATGARQNVSAVPADDAPLTFLATASTAYPINLAFHKNAFAFVTADLEKPKGTDMAYQTRKDNLSMRFIRDYDSKNDEWISRFDVLWGCKAVRPNLACRVWGKVE
jgi:hypothetical protein